MFLTENLILLFACAGFSFLCSFFKQLYEAEQCPKSKYFMMVDTTLSGVSGLIVGLILSEILKNELAIIGFSGLGGMFGLEGLKLFMKVQLGKKIHLSVHMEDEHAEHAEHIQALDKPDNSQKKDAETKSPRKKQGVKG